MRAEAAFRLRVAEQDGVLLEPNYLGTDVRHRARCRAGHECFPLPASVRLGFGICQICTGNAPGIGEALFLERLAALGAKPLYDRWCGSREPHKIQCSEGHVAYPRPFALKTQGCGQCHREAPWRRFREWVTSLGGRVVEPAWLGATTPHRIICPAGHAVRTSPRRMVARGAVCKICSGKDPAASEAKFRARLAELGATPEYESWLGAQKKHLVRCAKGHASMALPMHVNGGLGACDTCHGGDPAVQEAEFIARLLKFGATPAYDSWQGSKAPHRVKCRAGHLCFPRPNGVQSGRNPCRFCAGMTWDVFYIVRHELRPEVKFGIASGDSRERLAAHRREGFTHRILAVEGLPGTVAPDTERAIKVALREAGYKPVRGREYFDLAALPVVLDVAGGLQCAE